MKQEQTAPTKSVKDRVLSTIDTESVAPRSRYVFLCQNWLVWGLWVISIVFGALALAVLLFVSTHRYYDLYEATHENFVTFILEALPFVWFGVFAAMLVLAVWQLRHTTRGYKFSAAVLGVSSFVLSIVLGALFHVGGFGWSLDMWLGTHAPMYTSQAEMERKMWQNPLEGRLVGRQIQAQESSQASTIVFRDAENVVWTVEVTDLGENDRAFLEQGEVVRLLGLRDTSQDQVAVFYACGVFPWMLDKPVAVAHIRREREVFVDRMYGHYESAEVRKDAIEAIMSDNRDTVSKDSPCYRIPATKRVYDQMHR